MTLTDLHLSPRGSVWISSWKDAGVGPTVLDLGRADPYRSISMFQGFRKMGNSSVKAGVLARTAVVVVTPCVVHEHLHVFISLPVEQLEGQVFVGPETFQNKVLAFVHNDGRGWNTETHTSSKVAQPWFYRGSGPRRSRDVG